jgi:hypothetical protein
LGRGSWTFFTIERAQPHESPLYSTASNSNRGARAGEIGTGGVGGELIVAEVSSRPGRVAQSCRDLDSWSGRSGAVPINNDLVIRFSGPVGSRIELNRVEVRIQGSFRLEGTSRLRCSTLIYNEFPPDYRIAISVIPQLMLSMAPR